MEKTSLAGAFYTLFAQFIGTRDGYTVKQAIKEVNTTHYEGVH